MPHEQGAWMLLCVSGGAVEGTDGGKSTSRDLPPAAFGGTGDGETGGICAVGEGVCFGVRAFFFGSIFVV